MFHRLSVPTYFGGLPVGYDYINDPATNGDAGVPAFVDGKKASGPNEGTYLTAFGEDATSAFMNRPAGALAENCDILDDLFHRDISVPARTGDVVAGGGGVTSFVISGQVYVGDFGVTNNQATRDSLVSILDNNDNEIVTAAGTKVQALLIHDGSSNNVVGTQASGYYSSPTVNLNVAIPAGVTYRVVYGERGNLATLPKNALTSISIRSAQEVSAGVEVALRELHAPGGVQAWNDPWDATIRALASAGLNERYRRQTAVAGIYNYNTPGDGARILRDGPAVEIQAPQIAIGTDPYPDLYLAMLRLSSASVPAAGGTYPLATRGGDIGVYRDLDFNSTNDANEFSRLGLSGPTLLEAIPRDIRSGTLASQTARFFINNTANATLNPDSGGSANDRATIQAPAGQYFKITAGPSAGKTTLRKRLDMVEVTVAGVVGLYIIEDIPTNTRVRVRHVNGKQADFGALAVTNARIRVIQPTISLGGTPDLGFGGQESIRNFIVSRVPYLQDNLGDAITGDTLAAMFLAGRPGTLAEALTIGYADDNGDITPKTHFYGDGSIVSEQGRISGMLLNSAVDARTIVAGVNNFSYNPYETGGTLVLTAGAAITTTTTINLTWGGGFVPQAGDDVTIFIYIQPGSVGVSAQIFTATWPSNVKFSGTDGTIPDFANATFAAVKYTLKYIGTNWWATRTLY